ncbi:restriction endonuclease subunit S [Actinomadura sediminis]|uniref:Type I restriction modification DNA specificity domain-containing protein n=1 Tax=Actinomadura sediminis TaxID=1038904 RepID=A0ABW3ERB4_9ACTN
MLDRADALRVKRREAIALFDELTQSVFIDMFGDPLFNPMGWPTQPLGDFFTIKPNYGTMVPASSDSKSFTCLRVANIQNWQIDLSDRKYVDLAPKDLSRHSLSEGDIVLARAIASQEHLGKAIVVYPGIEKWAFDSHLMRLRFDPARLLPEYVQGLLRSAGGRRIFLKAARRSAVQFNVNAKEMSALSVPVPPIELQRRFVERLRSLQRLKRSHEAHLAHLDELFASVQQRAFRGELWED